MKISFDKIQTLQKNIPESKIGQTLSRCQSQKIISTYSAPPSNFYHTLLHTAYKNGQLDDNYDALCQCNFLNTFKIWNS